MEIDLLGYPKREVASLAGEAKYMITQAVAIGSLVIDLTRAYAPHLAKVATSAVREAITPDGSSEALIIESEDEQELTCGVAS